jgi:hypothetical protein
MLKCLNANEPQARAILTDISEPMLRMAYRTVVAYKRRRPQVRSVIPVGINFAENLRGLRRAGRLHPELRLEPRTLFLLLGCTFANDNELALLHSLRSALLPGDILVLGVEFHRTGDGHEKRSSRFLLPYKAPSFKAYWDDHFKRLKRDRRNYAKLLRMSVEDSGERSTIPNTLSVTGRLLDHGLNETFMISNRYDEREFIDYVSSFSFTHIFSQASPLNPFYKHVVFERIR